MWVLVSGDVTGDYEILPLHPKAGQAAQEEFGLPLMLDLNMRIVICVLDLEVNFNCETYYTQAQSMRQS